MTNIDASPTPVQTEEKQPIVSDQVEPLKRHEEIAKKLSAETRRRVHTVYGEMANHS